MTRNVNGGHVMITTIKYLLQYRWRIKTRLNMVYKIRTLLKYLKPSPSIFIDRNETRRNNVIIPDTSTGNASDTAKMPASVSVSAGVQALIQHVSV